VPAMTEYYPPDAKTGPRTWLEYCQAEVARMMVAGRDVYVRWVWRRKGRRSGWVKECGVFERVERAERKEGKGKA
jgi:hypothetical protein